MSAGYSGRPLPAKLGIKPGSRVLVSGAPDGFDLGPLPGDVAFVDGSPADVVLCFVTSYANLTEDVIREHALGKGLVDNLVCAVTDVWSGLRIVHRRENRG